MKFGSAPIRFPLIQILIIMCRQSCLISYYGDSLPVVLFSWKNKEELTKTVSAFIFQSVGQSFNHPARIAVYERRVCIRTFEHVYTHLYHLLGLRGVIDTPGKNGKLKGTIRMVHIEIIPIMI